MSSDREFVTSMRALRDQASNYLAQINAAHREQLSRFQDELPALKEWAKYKQKARDVLRKELKDVAAELAALNRRNAERKKQPPPVAGGAKASVRPSEELKTDIQRLSEKQVSLDKQIASVREEVARSPISERELLESQLLALQDTKHILKKEMERLRVEVVRLQHEERVTEESAHRAATGVNDVARLEEEISRTDAELDQLKQHMYFPECGGHIVRFGSGGVYVGAKDFFISEISCAFTVSAERQTVLTGKQPTACVMLHLGGSLAPGTSEFADLGLQRLSATGGQPAPAVAGMSSFNVDVSAQSSTSTTPASKPGPPAAGRTLSSSAPVPASSAAAGPGDGAGTMPLTAPAATQPPAEPLGFDGGQDLGNGAEDYVMAEKEDGWPPPAAAAKEDDGSGDGEADRIVLEAIRQRYFSDGSVSAGSGGALLSDGVEGLGSELAGTSTAILAGQSLGTSLFVEDYIDQHMRQQSPPPAAAAGAGAVPAPAASGAARTQGPVAQQPSDQQRRSPPAGAGQPRMAGGPAAAAVPPGRGLAVPARDSAAPVPAKRQPALAAGPATERSRSGGALQAPAPAPAPPRPAAASAPPAGRPAVGTMPPAGVARQGSTPPAAAVQSEAQSGSAVHETGAWLDDPLSAAPSTSPAAVKQQQRQLTQQPSGNPAPVQQQQRQPTQQPSGNPAPVQQQLRQPTQQPSTSPTAVQQQQRQPTQQPSANPARVQQQLRQQLPPPPPQQRAEAGTAPLTLSRGQSAPQAHTPPSAAEELLGLAEPGPAGWSPPSPGAGDSAGGRPSAERVVSVGASQGQAAAGRSPEARAGSSRGAAPQPVSDPLRSGPSSPPPGVVGPRADAAAGAAALPGTRPDAAGRGVQALGGLPPAAEPSAAVQRAASSEPRSSSGQGGGPPGPVSEGREGAVDDAAMPSTASAPAAVGHGAGRAPLPGAPPGLGRPAPSAVAHSVGPVAAPRPGDGGAGPGPGGTAMPAAAGARRGPTGHDLNSQRQRTPGKNMAMRFINRIATNKKFAQGPPNAAAGPQPGQQQALPTPEAAGSRAGSSRGLTQRFMRAGQEGAEQEKLSFRQRLMERTRSVGSRVARTVTQAGNSRIGTGGRVVNDRMRSRHGSSEDGSEVSAPSTARSGGPAQRRAGVFRRQRAGSGRIETLQLPEPDLSHHQSGQEMHLFLEQAAQAALQPAGGRQEPPPMGDDSELFGDLPLAEQGSGAALTGAADLLEGPFDAGPADLAAAASGGEPPAGKPPLETVHSGLLLEDQVLEPPTLQEGGSQLQEEQLSKLRQQQQQQQQQEQQQQPATARPARAASVSSDADSLGGTDLESTSQMAMGSKGVYIALHVENIHMIGERGSRVPSLKVEGLTLEVEALMRMDVVFQRSYGWRLVRPPQFEVLHLHSVARGSSIPLPKTVIKYILNLIMPKVLERKLVTMLPRELGSYLLEGGTGIALSGELLLVGPPLSTLRAPLGVLPDPGHERRVAVNKRKLLRQAKQSAAAQEARAMLGLTTQQARILEQVLCDSRSGVLQEPLTELTMSQLCRFYQRAAHIQPQLWEQLCAVINTAVQTVAQRWRVAESFDFSSWINGVVAQMARKPIRMRFLLSALDVSCNVDEMLHNIRNFCERSIVELHQRSEKGGNKAIAVLPKQPLDVQLSALRVWHEYSQQRLQGFKHRFRSASLTAVATADSRSFQVGAEDVVYNGPLSLELPVDVKPDSDGSLSFSIGIPAPKDTPAAVSELIAQLRSIGEEVGGAGFANLFSSSDGRDQSKDGQLELRESQADEEEAEASATGSGRKKEKEGLGMIEMDDALKYLETLGRLIVNRINFTLCVDERRIRDVLGNPDHVKMNSGSVARLLSGLGEVMRMEFVPSSDGRAGTADEERQTSGYHLRIKTSEVSLVKARLDSLGFQSNISPATAVRIAHVFALKAVAALKLGSPELPKLLDRRFQQICQYIDKRALDVSGCVNAGATLEHGDLIVRASVLNAGGGSCQDSCKQAAARGGSSPPALMVVNDVDLMNVLDALRVSQDGVSVG